MYTTLPVFELAILSGLLSVVVAGVGYWRCHSQSRLLRYSFISTLLAGAVWAGGFGAYLAVEPAYSYHALAVMWLGGIPYVTLWFVFVLAYTGHEELLGRSTLGLLAIEPAVMLAAAATTASHGLFLTGETVGLIAGYESIVPTIGPLFVFHLVYLFLLANAALLLLVRTLGDTDPAYHPQLLAILLVGTVPLVGPIEQVFDLSAAALGSTPLLFVLSNLVLLGAIARYRLFDMLPTARNRVLSTMEDGVVLIDDEKRIRLANTAARQQLSLPEPVIGRDASAVLPCGEQLVTFCTDDELPENLLSTRPDGGSEPRTDGGAGELRPHPSGVELILGDTQFIVSTEPVPVETAVEGQLLVFRDVTTQREHELELQAVIEHTSDVVLIVEPDGDISYASPSAETELAYTQLELVDRDVTTLFHADDTDSIAGDIEAVVGTDEVAHSQYRLKTGDDDWRMVETTVRGSESTPTTDGVIVTTRDITERYRHQQRRRVMNRVLRHDLRNDMNVVVGHAEILVDMLDDDRVRHAETIEEKASYLVGLGEKVRKIDQRLHGRDREFQRIELARMVREEVQTVHEAYPDASVRTRLEDVSIWGDTLIRSAVANLIENAVEHNDRPTPKVEVITRHNEKSGRIELTVSDNGSGIPEAERRVITAGVETPLEHISGLGLWLVKWIVEGMDGELRIETKETHGSIVTLSFPPIEEAIKNAEENPSPSTATLNRTVASKNGSGAIQTTTRSTD